MAKTDLDISFNGICELISYECICLQPYLDSVKVKTVGIGSTASDIADLASWDWDKKISVEEAVRLFKLGLAKYVAAVNKSLEVSVSQSLFDALVSITYNIGINGMKKSTFIKRVNAKESLQSIIEAMSRYNQGGGRIIKGLANRRAKEANLVLTGSYSSGGNVPLVPVVNKRPCYKQAKNISLRQYIIM